MYSTRRTTSRLALLFLLLALAVLPLAGCGSGSSPGSASPDDQGTTVSGQVVYRDTGKPYAGATVEFKDVYGYYAYTTTDTDGHYSLTLPADTYDAEALDQNNLFEGFDVVGRPDEYVSVPPSTTVNFVAYSIG